MKPWLAVMAVTSLAPAALACGSSDAAPAVPAQMPSVADGALIALAPAGAELVAELDLARLRDSEGLGAHVEAIRSDDEAIARGGLDLLAADALLLASYHLGQDAAQTLTFIRGDQVVAGGFPALSGAEMLDERTAVLGPPELVKLAVETAAGARASLASEPRLMELRQAAIPAAAPGAALRVSGELGFDARVGLSNLLSLADVPVAISVWGDVVDDVAVVALLGAESEQEALRLAAGAVSWRERAAGMAPIVRAGLAPVVQGAEVVAEGATVQVTIVIPPARLDRVAGALIREILGAQKEAS